MAIVVLAVGKLKGVNRYLQTGVDEYVKRISAYRPITIVEIPEETISATRTEAQVKDAEGERILAQLAKYGREGNMRAVALSEQGELPSSLQLAKTMFGTVPGETNQPNGGTPWALSNPIIFVIGGPLGLSQKVLAQCHSVLSLSRMTLTHPMARLFLVEQIYRAFKIHRNEPYHKA